MPNKINKQFLIWAGVLFAVLLLVDRYYWAQISQWREDQATNIWLGYTAGIGKMPVGLISSANIPNPNGMGLLGFFLSVLPNLLSVSFFLGAIQIILLVLVGWKSFDRDWRYFLLATIPSLSSIILRSTSVEFWNQYTITLINVFFLFWALRYLKNGSLWNIPPITILILLAPSLYLAGIVNAIVITLLTLGIIIYKRPAMDNIGAVFVVTAMLVLLSVFLTWLPYFQNINLNQISSYNKARLGPVIMFQAVWESFFGLPIYGTMQWADKTTFASAFKHSDPRILSYSTEILLRMAGRAYLLQAVFAFTTFIYTILVSMAKGISTGSFDAKINFSIARMVTLCCLFICLSYAFSAWLGGPAWIKGERLDQAVQYLPMFLYLIFLLPLMVIRGANAEKTITRISYGSLIIFCALNLTCGFMIIRDHLQYRGDALTEADVPLTDKMQAIDFIADDWSKYSKSNVVPIDYDLGGGIWDWVSDFGIRFSRWYPAPMTEGRGFDYEFLRRYGLKNQQEGIQLRTFGNGRYLVTYAFEDPPQVADGRMTHHIFGRLRVSVVER
jgi:hypothetical protein